MRYALILIAALFVVPAWAERSFVARSEDGSVVIRIYDSPCTKDSVLALLKPDRHPHYRKAATSVRGDPFDACWRQIATEAGPAVFLLDEGGSSVTLPITVFQGEPGV